jgi:hypothetical protein
MPKSKTDDERKLAARAALAEQFGRPLSDEEWSLYSARLLAYVRLLRDWERKDVGDNAP